MLKIEPYFNDNRKELPKLTIEIEGQPLCALMKAQHTVRKNQPNRDVAKELWDEIARRLCISLGFRQARRGRPKTDMGFQAAFLHYHLGWNWPKIARELCPTNHTHTNMCEDNYYVHSKKYFTRLRKAVSAMKK